MPAPYEAARESTALFDLRDRAQIELTGRDAREFLHNLCTQDMKNLPVGESREAFLTTSKARVIAHLWIWHRKPDVLLLDFAGRQTEKVLDHLNRHLISEQVEVSNVSGTCLLLRVLGPRAASLVASVGLVPARPQPLTGFEGCDLFLSSGDGGAGAFLDRMIEAGAVVGDDAAYNVLRVEAGMPEFGIDVDEDRLAMEVNRPQAVSYTKGCYLGQETIVMARDRGQVNRRLMGVKVPTGEPLAFGTKLLRANEEVGHVTSSVFSPRMRQVIALAYLRRGTWDAGMELVIGERTAVVSALPFSASS